SREKYINRKLKNYIRVVFTLNREEIKNWYGM
ncbi:MAG: hypothetical protein ACI9IT_001120, partial [Glaciecola sp.]